MKNRAIAACNNELNTRISQGGKRSDIFKAGFQVEMNKTRHQITFTCNGSSPWSGHPRSVDHNHPITVQCGAYKPQFVAVVPNTLPVFKLLSADISMNSSNYQGTCPANLPVKATIKTNTLGGSFQYRFLEDGKAMGSWKNKTEAKGQATLIPKPNAGVPDLTSRQGITIGQQTSAWNGTINLTAADANATGPRGCSYRMKYDVVNIGKAKATGFSSRLFDPVVIHSRGNMQLEKTSSANVSGNILPRTGTHILQAKIDDTNQVSESKENNNNFKVKVVVPKGCGENQPPTPRTAIPERQQIPRPQ